eukprot:scaffold107778_cov16-Tisochrysis_lutea.AAC.1
MSHRPLSGRILTFMEATCLLNSAAMLVCTSVFSSSSCISTCTHHKGAPHSTPLNLAQILELEEQSWMFK